MDSQLNEGNEQTLQKSKRSKLPTRDHMTSRRIRDHERSRDMSGIKWGCALESRRQLIFRIWYISVWGQTIKQLIRLPCDCQDMSINLYEEVYILCLNVYFSIYYTSSAISHVKLNVRALFI